MWVWLEGGGGGSIANWVRPRGEIQGWEVSDDKYHKPATRHKIPSDTLNRPFYFYLFLNLLDLRSIMGCPGGEVLAQYFRALFGQKGNFNVYFSGKRRSLLHPKTAQRSFFFHYNLFLGKLKEKLSQKVRVNTDASI